MKKTLFYILSPAILLIFLVGCSMPVSNADGTDTPDVQRSWFNIFQYSYAPVTDGTGQVQTVVHYASTSGQHNTVTAFIGADEVLVGGGAYTSNTNHDNFRGGFLTGSYPYIDANGQATGWTVQSKDHMTPYSHTTTAYAVGMRLKDSFGRFVPKSTILKYMMYVSATSGYAEHPSAVAYIPANYRLLSGGARVMYPFGEDGINIYGNLLTESQPINDSVRWTGWEAASKDHFIYSPAEITAYAICIRDDQPIPRFGYLSVCINYENTASSIPNSESDYSSSNSNPGYCLIAAGGYTKGTSYGRLLTTLRFLSDNHTVNIREREVRPLDDWTHYDSGTYMVREIKIKKDTSR
jgi:hypothetical protein